MNHSKKFYLAKAAMSAGVWPSQKNELSNPENDSSKTVLEKLKDLMKIDKSESKNPVTDSIPDFQQYLQNKNILTDDEKELKKMLLNKNPIPYEVNIDDSSPTYETKNTQNQPITI